MEQKYKYKHHSTHTQSNTQTNNQTTHIRKANSLSCVLIYRNLAQLICSISCKQWTQIIFRYNKFLQKSSCENINLS